MNINATLEISYFISIIALTFVGIYDKSKKSYSFIKLVYIIYMVSDLRSSDRGFDSRSGRYQAT